MKKILLVLLVLALLLLVAAGCKKDVEDGVDSTSESVSESVDDSDSSDGSSESQKPSGGGQESDTKAPTEDKVWEDLYDEEHTDLSSDWTPEA